MDETKLPPFTVTPRAVEAIGNLGGRVRVRLEPSGCCGTFYAFDLGVEPADHDGGIYGCEGAWLQVDPEAERVLAGATLDWSGRLKPPRFRVLAGPDSGERCPCRRSFGAPWPGPGQTACRSYEPMPWDESYTPPADWQRRTGWSARCE